MMRRPQTIARQTSLMTLIFAGLLLSSCHTWLEKVKARNIGPNPRCLRCSQPQYCHPRATSGHSPLRHPCHCAPKPHYSAPSRSQTKAPQSSPNPTGNSRALENLQGAFTFSGESRGDFLKCADFGGASVKAQTENLEPPMGAEKPRGIGRSQGNFRQIRRSSPKIAGLQGQCPEVSQVRPEIARFHRHLRKFPGLYLEEPEPLQNAGGIARG